MPLCAHRSSQASDPFGLAVVGRDPRRPGALVLGLARAWKPTKGRSTSFEERRAVEDRVLAEVAEAVRPYTRRVVTDQYAAPQIVAALKRHGLSVRVVAMTGPSKTEAFGEMRARLNLGALELYDAPGLLAELRRLRTRYAAGAASVVNPRVSGSHGDQAQALALATFAHRRAIPPRDPAAEEFSRRVLAGSVVELRGRALRDREDRLDEPEPWRVLPEAKL